MNIATVLDLSKELKSRKNQNVYRVFDEYCSNHNISSDELEKELISSHNTFRCDSCERFYDIKEYFIDEAECVFCVDTQADDD
ncbi:MAG: hypothetical protein WC144_01370 [Sulfurimonas sp.]|jgi:hypothetical protein|nr:hypothetical protein [Sulfurimonadaceae bacterium]